MIRVILDFSDLHNVAHTFLWFEIDNCKFSTIFDLKSKICDKFNLTNIQLYIKNALLGDDIAISIIREDDVIRIIQVNEKEVQDVSFVQCSEIDEAKHVAVKKQLKRSHECNDESSQNVSTDNFTFCSEEIVPSSSIAKRRKKQKKVKINETLDVPCNRNGDIFVEDNSVRLASILNSSLSKNFESQPSEISTQSCDVLESAENVSYSTLDVELVTENKDTSNDGIDSDKKKRKRRRGRRRRKTSLIVHKVQNFENNLGTSKNSSALSSLKSVNAKKQNKHIKFLDSFEDLNDSDLIANESLIESTDKSELQMSLESTENFSSEVKNKEGTSLQNNETCIAQKSFSDLSFTCDDSFAIPVNQFNNKEKQEDIPIANKFPLTVIPKVGDHIAYKILELSESYCPEVSAYREGIVRNVDSNGYVTVDLFQKEVTYPRSGKFEVEWTDEETQPKIVETLVVNWSAMIEPKIIIRQDTKTS